MANNMRNMVAYEWADAALDMPEYTWDYDKIPDGVLDAAGTFNMLSLHQLQAMLPSQPRRQLAPMITYRVRDKNHPNDDLFDTSALQYDCPPHCRTLFQVASNYNCLELGKPWGNPFNGTYLNGLMIDSTQGPSAAAGAGAGAIMRTSIHKWGPLDDRPALAPVDTTDVIDLNLARQSVRSPTDYSKTEMGGYINLLSDVPELANIAVNGKLYNNKKTSKILPSNSTMDDAWIYNIKVGIQEGVRAQYYRGPYRCHDGYCIYNKDGTRIDQVYTSTCIIDSSKSANDNFTKAMLKAAYDGTYLTAVAQQSRRLVLTFIGGHAFNNPMRLIIQAIVDAHEKYGQYLHSQCKIVLPIYDTNWGYISSLLDSNHDIFSRESNYF